MTYIIGAAEIAMNYCQCAITDEMGLGSGIRSIRGAYIHEKSI